MNALAGKRTKNVMLRFTSRELEALKSEMPEGAELATFLRERLLTATNLRRSAAFVVAALSKEIDFEEALDLFDKHAAGDPTR